MDPSEKEASGIIKRVKEAPWVIKLAFGLIALGISLFTVGEIFGWVLHLPTSAEIALFEDQLNTREFTRTVGILSFLVGAGLLRHYGRDSTRRSRSGRPGQSELKVKPIQWQKPSESESTDQSADTLDSTFQLLRRPPILVAYAVSALCGALTSMITIYALFDSTEEAAAFLSSLAPYFMIPSALICLAFSYFAMDIALPSKTTQTSSKTVTTRALLGILIGIIPGSAAAAVFTTLFVAILF